MPVTNDNEAGRIEYYANLAVFPAVGNTKIEYCANDSGLLYRWSGSAYVELSAGVTLGETSTTAYRGDRGKTAYDHSQTAHVATNHTHDGLLMTETLTTDLTVEGLTEVKTAGENVVFGDVCYFKSDGKMWKAKADSITTCGGRLLMATGTINANATGTFLRIGKARNDAWNWTVGVILYVSAATGGTLTETQPAATDNVIQVVGRAEPTGKYIFFNPSPDYMTHV